MTQANYGQAIISGTMRRGQEKQRWCVENETMRRGERGLGNTGNLGGERDNARGGKSSSENKTM
ncbi:hypothetical protein BDN67DRAFT_973315 [Paxillus ammoniavirescens]|nr:hypothetical protein BDN67DRAFT_973315 [Paxillus ammoniavirescens]